MADDIKRSKTPTKTIDLEAKADSQSDELTDEELLESVEEALDHGALQIENPKAALEETFTKETLEKFILGEITWAQLQGMTMEEAYQIAEYAYSLYQEARYHDARTLFEGLVICNPYDAYFHTMLGAVFQQLDMHDEAIEEYGIALNLDDQSLHAHFNRAELLLSRGKFSEALDDLRRVIELDPDGKHEVTARARVLTQAIADTMAKVEEVVGASATKA